MRQVIREKLKESLYSILPVTIIVLVLCFSITPVPVSTILLFFVGAVLLILGMALFTLGAEIAMTPMGETLGAHITKQRKLWLLIIVGFLLGFIITIAEPGLQVLAEQVATIPNAILIGTVAAGVGIFLVIALLRILFRLKLSYILLGFYAFLFLFSYFVPADFLPVAFDAGGATTGSMTVPFIMALGVGVASVRSDRDAEDDSFGLIAVCSIGPIVTVMILGMIYTPEGAYSPITVTEFGNTVQVWQAFMSAFPTYFMEVLSALAPIAVFFALYQVVSIRLPKQQMLRIIVGIIYTYVGLVLFLTGANVGFLPAGNLIGQALGSLSYNWILIPIGMIIGYFIISAEPAVYVLNKQVEAITEGAISQRSMKLGLSVGVALSLGLSMLRILTGISIMWILLPGYVLAIGLAFFVPKIFTAIAFDSGGVASGPLTSTFLLPLAMGASSAVGGNIITDAFGVIAMVAMTPLITIQIMGLYYKIKSTRNEDAETQTASDIEIIDISE